MGSESSNQKHYLHWDVIVIGTAITVVPSGKNNNRFQGGKVGTAERRVGKKENLVFVELTLQVKS